MCNQVQESKAHGAPRTSARSVVMQECMIFSVSIFCLYRKPMNWMLPSARRRACSRHEPVVSCSSGTCTAQRAQKQAKSTSDRAS